jgi:hypothetical protein
VSSDVVVRRSVTAKLAEFLRQFSVKRYVDRQVALMYNYVIYIIACYNLCCFTAKILIGIMHLFC